MRFPHVISKNTKEEYTPSEVAVKLLKEADKQLFPENLEWGDDDCPTLVTFCLWAISKNFENRPIIEDLSFCADRDHLLEILPTDLPLLLMVPLIDNEIYWQRRYTNKFGMIMQRLYRHWTWKRLFLERYMQEVIEEAQPQYKDEDDMADTTKLLCPFVLRLTITQLQTWKPPLTWEPDEIPEIWPTDHINLQPIFKELTKIEQLDIILGMNNVGEEFQWNMFKFTLLDVQRLTNAILSLKELRILRLHRSRLDDLYCQTLMHGIIKNETLIELDLSHCHIGDQGALCIAKVMTVHPTLETIKLANNQIQALGGQGIGFALLEETCCPITHLDLRLNPLGHDGVMGIFRALVRGTTVKELNLAGCSFEDDTPIRLGQVLNLNRSLEVLDVSNNWLGDDGGNAIVRSLMNNKVMRWLDVRETDIPLPCIRLINKLLKRNRLAEEEIEEEEESEEIEIENIYAIEEVVEEEVEDDTEEN